MRKYYTTPLLIVHGSVEKITLAPGNNGVKPGTGEGKSIPKRDNRGFGGDSIDS